MRRFFSENSLGTTVSRVNISDINEIKVPLPPTLAEQEAIANALSDADAYIESLEKLIEKKRQIKTGAMQELLTGKRRLPGFKGEWKMVRLADFGFTYGGLTGKTKVDFGAGNAKYITFLSVMRDVVIQTDTSESVVIADGEQQNQVLAGDLIFNGSSETPEEVAMCALVRLSDDRLSLNSFCFGYRLFGADLYPLFLAYYFRSREGRELVKQLAQGATRYNISKTALMRQEFQVPDLVEQMGIAQFITDMDSEIAALGTKLSKARLIKQGMMQELLTGRIRLV
jgi:type I restriction enzyme S subunit